MKNKHIFLTIIFVSLTATSCDPDRVYEEFVEIPSHNWDMEYKPVFNPFINDTSSSHNIYLNIRNGSGYSYRNLYVFITTTSPTGQWVCDTIDCILADEKGRWYGSGWGDIHELRIPYKKNIKFPDPGYYSFEIEQAMRKKHLKGIYDIGIRIEKEQNSNIPR